MTAIEDEFMHTNKDMIFNTSSYDLKKFAKKTFGVESIKNLAFIGGFNNAYILATADFLPYSGKRIQAKFENAMEFLRTPIAQTQHSVIKIAALDGAMHLPGEKMRKELVAYAQHYNIMSALLLKRILSFL